MTAGFSKKRTQLKAVAIVCQYQLRGPMKIKSVLLGVVILFGSSSLALADSLTPGVSYQVVAEACVLNNQCNDNQLSSSLVPLANGARLNVGILNASNSFSLPGSAGFDLASSSGSITYGTISAAASASGNLAVDFAPPSATDGVSASGFFSGTWQDSLLVTSNSLTAGTPVDLLFTLTLQASLNCTNTGAVFVIGSLTAGSSNTNLSSTTCNSVLNQTTELLVSTFVGQNIPIFSQLNMTASGVAFNDGVGFSSLIDPPDSSVFIASQTEGASFLSASGATYAQASPVPEPGTIALLGSGLLVSGFKRLRRKNAALIPKGASSFN
jgi:hypothetical protein